MCACGGGGGAVGDNEYKEHLSLLGSLKGGSTSLLGEPHYCGDKEVSCLGEVG